MINNSAYIELIHIRDSLCGKTFIHFSDKGTYVHTCIQYKCQLNINILSQSNPQLETRICDAIGLAHQIDKISVSGCFVFLICSFLVCNELRVSQLFSFNNTKHNGIMITSFHNQNDETYILVFQLPFLTGYGRLYPVHLH